jgi:hypothetical protein
MRQGVAIRRRATRVGGVGAEVVAVMELPEAHRDASFDEVVDSDLQIFDAVYEHGLQQCMPELAEWSGLPAALAAIPTWAASAESTWPLLNTNLQIFTESSATWDTNPGLLCVMEWRAGNEPAQSVSSPSDAPLVASIRTGDVPGRHGMCPVERAGGAVGLVDCDADPHPEEILFVFDANLVLGADSAVATDQDEPTVDQLVALDAVCAAAAPAVFGTERTVADLLLRARLSARSAAIDAFGAARYSVLCSAVPTDPAMLIKGSVWGIGSEPADLVPAG